MFKGTEELKQFIVWAKEQGLKSVKVGEISFEVSDYEIAQRIVSQTTPNVSAEASDKPVESRIDYLKEQAKSKSEDEELLFWSSR